MYFNTRPPPPPLHVNQRQSLFVMFAGNISLTHTPDVRLHKEVSEVTS